MTSAFNPNQPIITSLLDTDFYKLTMMQAVHHQYPNTDVVWEFRCRNSEDLLPYLEEIQEEVSKLADLTLSDGEADYLSGIGFMAADFVRFLKLFRFNPNYVRVYKESNELCIRLAGPWSHVILFEVPVLAIVSEVRNRTLHPDTTVEMAIERYREKAKALRDDYSDKSLSDFNLADFGTRRRFSRQVQASLLVEMQTHFPGRLVGTSNVDMARRLDLKPMGTMAHEWLMAHQQLGGSRIVDSQKAALEAWVQEYRGELGIALTDCITTDAFLRDFDLYFAKLFDGLRHDSGDPLDFAEKCICRYKELGIDPMTKTLIFSDGLTLDKAMKIKMALTGRINTSFGIGTSLTCDIPGVTPLNIVLKMTECNGQPVAKISDSPGKTLCRDEHYVRYLKDAFEVKPTPWTVSEK